MTREVVDRDVVKEFPLPIFVHAPNQQSWTVKLTYTRQVKHSRVVHTQVPL